MKKYLAVCLIVVLVISVSHCASVFADETMPGGDFAVALNDKRDYLTLVNNDHPYEFGGEYDEALQEDLIYVSDCLAIPTPVEKAAALAFSELVADLHMQGVDIALFSAYRTEDDQQWVYDNYAELDGWGESNTVMKPGFSEHHTGLMIEYMVWYNGGDESAPWEWYTVSAERASDPYYQPIWDTMAKYGFILRYPEGKESITGITYEPYELRFVGSSQIATDIMSQGLCLEEYLEQQH